jgi:WD40 repeat protein/uncharacterized caspase-like protein
MKKTFSIFLFLLTCVFSFGQENVELVIQKGHLAPITTIEYSSTDEFLLSTDQQGNIIIWNARLGKQVSSMLSSEGVSLCKFVPGKFQVVYSTPANKLVAWDFEKNEILSSIVFSDHISDFSFMTADRLFVASNVLYAVDPASGEKSVIQAVAYSRVQCNPVEKTFIAIDESTMTPVLFDAKSVPVATYPRINTSTRNLMSQLQKDPVTPGQFVIDAGDQTVHFPIYNMAWSIDLKSGAIRNQLFTDYFDINCTAVGYSSKNQVIIYGTTDNKLFYYNAAAKKTKLLSAVHLSEISDICFSTSQDYFATASKDQSIIIWNTHTLKAVHRLALSALPLYSIAADESGSTLAAGNGLGEIKIISLGRGLSETTITNVMAHTEIVSDLAISDSLIFSSGFDNYVVVTNTRSAELKRAKAGRKKMDLKIFEEPKGTLADEKFEMGQSVFYNAETGIISMVSNEFGNKTISQYNFGNGELVYQAQWNPERMDHAALREQMLANTASMNAGNFEFTSINTSSSKSWSVKQSVVMAGPDRFLANNQESFSLYLSGAQLTELWTRRASRVSGAFAYEPALDLIAYSSDNNVYLLSADLKDTCIGSHQLRVTDLCFLPNANLLITSSEDGTIKAWDYKNYTAKCSIIPVHRNQLLLVNPDNYYYSINDAVSEIGFKVGANLYPAEQFDLRFNRPDIVLAGLGITDSNLVAAYHMAYLKRLKKNGFTEEMLTGDLQIPAVRISNLANIPPQTSEEFIRLNLEMEDQLHNLDRINVWINDVAIYGTGGIPLRSLDTMVYRTELEMPLANGKNKIELSVLNTAGAESYKEMIEITSVQTDSPTNLYVVAIGVSNYKDQRYALSYAAKDAKDLTALFAATNLYNQVYAKTLTDSEVTRENLEALKTFLSPAGINDQVIVFVAGHGVLDNAFNYYFAGYDMDFQNPSDRGIPYEAIEGLLDGIKPLKKLLFMDTCHSGEVEKDEIQPSGGTTESGGDIVFRNVGLTVENKENHLGLQHTSELMKSLFTDLRRGTGATVISSAGGVEFAMESDTWQNGLFTYCLIHGLSTRAADLNRNKEITISELQFYVQSEVGKLSNGMQTPTSRIVNQEMDYRIW